jgi:PAS domain S-box
MEFDIRTLILVIVTTYLIQASVFFYQYKINKNIKGPGWCVLWSVAETIMLALMFLRDIPSFQHLVIFLQNAIGMLGMIFLYIGTLRFFDKRVNLKSLALVFFIFLMLHLYFNFINDDIKIRTILISVLFSLISFSTAFSIIKFKNRELVLSANFTATVFIIYGSFFVNRAIMTFLGVQPTDVMSPSLLNALVYFIGLIVSLVLTLGYIMMINQRLNSETTEAKTHFELIFNTSPDAITINRLSDGCFLECNESFANISGFKKEDVSGFSDTKINFWKNPDDRLGLIKIVSEQGFCDNYEAIFLRKNGKEFTGLLSAKILNIKGIHYLLSVIRDITEKKQIEEELKHKNEELNSLNASKDKFFSIIAHDLKSPFNLFLGYTELMVEQSEGWTLTMFREYATRMRESATNLYHLLENLLDWSRMERGFIPFNPSPIHLNLLIDESLVLITEAAKLKEIEIISDINNNCDVLADKDTLQTVIRNLVSNAIKFTPRGGKITLSAIPIDNKKIQISIKDSGIGMSPAMVRNLFKLDGQTNRKGTENEPSTGLGLILCKEFVEKHSGRIWADSEEGKGSEFCFTLPYV